MQKILEYNSIFQNKIEEFGNNIEEIGRTQNEIEEKLRKKKKNMEKLPQNKNSIFLFLDSSQGNNSDKMILQTNI